MEGTILITGANRGIGLELARQYADGGWRVLACARRPEAAAELTALAADRRLEIHRLDVADPGQIWALAGSIEEPIDILFNNAGTIGSERQEFGQVEVEPWLQAFRVNTIGPLLLVQAFAGQVAASRKKLIAIMGTQMGSIGDNRSGGYYIYRSTKAAVHMVGKCLAADLQARGIITIVLHPGWVRTEMGGAGATLTPMESARGLRQVLEKATPAVSGRLFNYAGEELPW